MKVLLNSFHLNGHTLGFYPQTYLVLIANESTAQMLSFLSCSSGFPGSQPVSMDVQNIKLLHEKPYRVSWKADGVRLVSLQIEI